MDGGIRLGDQVPIALQLELDAAPVSASLLTQGLTLTAQAAGSAGDAYRFTVVNNPGGTVQEITDIATIASGGTKEITDIVTVAATGGTQEISAVTTIADPGKQQGYALISWIGGGASNYDGRYLIAYNQEGAGGVGFWIDVDDDGTSMPGALSGCVRTVEITTITSGMSQTQIESAVAAVIHADAQFDAVRATAGLVPVWTRKCESYPTFDCDFASVTGPTGGVASTLDRKYFIMHDEIGSVGVWLNIGPYPGVTPTTGCDRDIEVQVTASPISSKTKPQIGTAVYNVVVADSKFEPGSNDSAGNLLIKCTPYGARIASADADTGFTVGRDTAGTNSNLDGKYFILEDFDGTVGFWMATDGGGTTVPSGASSCDRAVEISTIITGMTAGQVGTEVYNAVIADSMFEAGSDDTAGNLTVQNVAAGPMTAQAAGDSGFTVGQNANGVLSPLDGKYFTMADDAGSVGVWLDVDNKGSSAPTTGCARNLRISSVGTMMTPGQVGTALYTDLIADSKFEAGSDDTNGNLTVKCTPYGARTASADVDTGFTVGRDTAGVSGPLSYTEVSGNIILDLVGLSPTTAQVVTHMMTTVPSSYVNVVETTPGSVIAATILPFTGGLDGLYPQAFVLDEAGTPITSMDLYHISDGFFLPSPAYTMPNNTEIFVQYFIYTDSGHTVLSRVYPRGVEGYNLISDVTFDEVGAAVLDVDRNDHNIAGTIGEAINNSGGAISPTIIAEAVWDEVLTGHILADSAGLILQDVLTDTGDIAAMALTVSTNLDAAVSTRSTLDGTGVQSAMISQGYTTGLATDLGTTNTTVAGLNDISTTDVQSAMTSQGYTTGLATALGSLNDISTTDVQSAMTSQGYTTGLATTLGSLNDISTTDVQSAMTSQGYTTGLATTLGSLNDISATDVQSAMTSQGYTTGLATALGSLNNISTTDVQSAMTSQGYTTGLATALGSLNNLSTTDVEDAILDAVMSDHLTPLSVGATINAAGSGATPATIAAAVWDEVLPLVPAVAASLVSQGLTFTAITPGAAGNAYRFTVVDSTGSGPLSYTEVGGNIILDLVGLTPTTADVVTFMTTTVPSTYVTVVETTPGYVSAATIEPFINGADVVPGHLALNTASVILQDTFANTATTIADITSLNNLSASQVENAVLDAYLAPGSHTADDTVGKYIYNSGASAIPEAIAAAVWNEPLVGHATLDSAGVALKDVLSASSYIGPINSLVSDNLDAQVSDVLLGISGLNDISAANVTAAVWDEVLTSPAHTGVGSAAVIVKDTFAETDAIYDKLPSSAYIMGSAVATAMDGTIDTMAGTVSTNLNAMVDSRSTLDGTGVRTALTAQGYTTTLASNLGTTNTTVSTNLDAKVSLVPGLVWDAVVVDHLATGSTGKALNDINLETDPGAIAIAVWDEVLTTGHTGVGSAGLIVKDTLADTSEVQGKLPTNKIMGSSDVNDHDTDIDTIVGKMPTNYVMGSSDKDNHDTDIDSILTNVDVKSSTLATSIALGTAQGNITDILTDTNEIQGKLPTNKIMGSSTAADKDGVIDNIKTRVDLLDTKTDADAREVINIAEHDATQLAIGTAQSDITDILADTNATQLKLPTHYIMGSSDQADHDTDIDTIVGKLPTNYIMGSSVVTDKDDEIDSILEDTNAIQLKLPTHYIMGSSVVTDKDDEIDAIKLKVDTYLDAKVSTVVTDIGLLHDISAGDVTAAVLDVQISPLHIGVGTVGAAINNGGSSPTLIASAVWNEVLTGHNVASSAGLTLKDVLADTDSIHTVVDTNLDATVSSRATQLSVHNLNDLSALEVENAVWEAETADHVLAGTMGEDLNDVFINTLPIAIAEAVWDVDLTSGHAFSNSAAVIVKDTLADTNQIQGKLPANYIMGSSVASDKDDEINSIKSTIDLNLNAKISSVNTNIAGLNNLSVTNVQSAMTSQGYTAGLATNLGASNTTIASNLDFKTSVIAAQVGALNNLSSAGVQTAMTAQGYTAARAAYLDKIDTNLDAKISSVNTNIANLHNLSKADVQVAMGDQLYTSALATALGATNSTVATRLDGPISVVNTNIATLHNLSIVDVENAMAAQGYSSTLATNLGATNSTVASNLDARVSSRESEVDALARANTDVGEHSTTQSAIAGLSNLSITGVRTALTAQGYTTGLADDLASAAPNMDEKVSDVRDDIAALHNVSVANIKTAVWDEPLINHPNAGSTGKKLDDISLDALSIAEAVWDEDLTLHTDSNSAGLAVQDTLADTNQIQLKLPNQNIMGSSVKTNQDAILAGIKSTVDLNLDTPISDVPGLVWDEDLASHADAGSTGKALDDLATSTDPAAVAAAVWDESLVSHVGADTAGGLLNFIANIEGGRWKIVNNQMIFYQDDNVTEVCRFNLKDATGNPTMSAVFERTKV